MKRKLALVAVIFLIVSNLFWFVFACYAIRQVKEERAKRRFYQNVIINGAIEKCGENGTVRYCPNFPHKQVGFLTLGLAVWLTLR